MAPYKPIMKFLGLDEEKISDPQSTSHEPMTPREILTYGIKEAVKYGNGYSRKNLIKYVCRL